MVEALSFCLSGNEIILVTVSFSTFLAVSVWLLIQNKRLGRERDKTQNKLDYYNNLPRKAKRAINRANKS